MRYLFILFISLALLLPAGADAATYNWTGAVNSNWSNIGNWNPVGNPSAGDDVAFGGSALCVVDQNDTVASIRLQSTYSGEVDMNANLTITGSGGFVQQGGTFNCGSRRLAINSGPFNVSGTVLSGTTFVSTSDTLICKGLTFTVAAMAYFNHNSGTIRFDSSATIDVVGSSLYNIVFNTSGTIHVSGTLVAAGSLSLYRVYSLLSGTIAAQGNVFGLPSAPSGTLATLISINGTGNQVMGAITAGGRAYLPPISILKNTGTLTLRDTLVVTNDWTFTVATVDAGAGTVWFNNTDIIPGSMAFNNVIFQSLPSNGFTITGTMDINGDMTIQSCQNGFSQGTINIAGNLVNNAVSTGWTGRTTMFVLDGSSDKSLTQAAGARWVDTVSVSKTSGSKVTLASNAKLNSLKILSGTFDQGAGYGLTTAGDLTVASGAQWSNTGSGHDSLGGNVINSGTVTIDGNGAGCGGADVRLTSTSGIQRTWSGTGVFSVTDAVVSWQNAAAPIYTYSSTDGLNNANWFFNSSCYPDNYLWFAAVSADTQGFTYGLDSCGRLASDGTRISGVFVFAEFDSVNLANNFKTLAARDTLTRAQAAACGSGNRFGGLSSGTRYFIGAATRDSSGVWSEKANIRSLWTRPSNPLRLSVAETPVRGDSGVVCSLSNIRALGVRVDMIKVFWSSSFYQTNPLLTPDTAFTPPRIEDLIVFTAAGLNLQTKYYFTVVCGIQQNPDSAGRWGLIDSRSSPAGNGDTLTMGGPNRPPAVLNTVDSVVTNGNGAAFFTLSANDPDGDKLTFWPINGKTTTAMNTDSVFMIMASARGYDTLTLKVTDGLDTVSFLLRVYFPPSTGLEGETPPAVTFCENASPNPCNPAALIRYGLAEPGNVSITVHDIHGKTMAAPVNRRVPAGYYSFAWGADAAPSGFYFISVRLGGYHKMIKVLLLK